MTYGSVVLSLAGHDKNDFQVVIKMDGDFAFVCNGKSRRIEKPKKKNIKHLKLLNTVLNEECLRSNKSIRLALRFFQKSVHNKPQRW